MLGLAKAQSCLQGADGFVTRYVCVQRRCYWKLADTPNIVLMHYRSPGMGKRSGPNSPPTAATPLTMQGRQPAAPGYLPPPEPDTAVSPVSGTTGAGPSSQTHVHAMHPETHLDGMHGHGETKPQVPGADGVPAAMTSPQELAMLSAVAAGDGMAHRAAWDYNAPQSQQAWYQNNSQLVRARRSPCVS